MKKSRGGNSVRRRKEKKIVMEGNGGGKLTESRRVVRGELYPVYVITAITSYSPCVTNFYWAM